MSDRVDIVLWCGEGHSGLGWYWWEEEYPEEGSSGPFPTQTHAIADASVATGFEVTVTIINDRPRPTTRLKESKPRDMARHETFLRGDLVRLRSGGPLMTIDSIGSHMTDDGKVVHCVCVWFSGDTRAQCTFDPAALKLEKARETG